MFLGNKMLLNEDSGNVLDNVELHGLTRSLPQYHFVLVLMFCMLWRETQSGNLYRSVKSKCGAFANQ